MAALNHMCTKTAALRCPPPAIEATCRGVHSSASHEATSRENLNFAFCMLGDAREPSPAECLFAPRPSRTQA
jgi:hypothetical protein